VLVVAEGIARGGVFQAHGGGDVAGIDSAYILPVVGVHPEDAAHALAHALVGVYYGLARLQLSGIDPEKGQLSHVGIGHNLEGQGGEGGFVVGAPPPPPPPPPPVPPTPGPPSGDRRRRAR
jgi:hypothetical protein